MPESKPTPSQAEIEAALHRIRAGVNLDEFWERVRLGSQAECEAYREASRRSLEKIATEHCFRRPS